AARLFLFKSVAPRSPIGESSQRVRERCRFGGLGPPASPVRDVMCAQYGLEYLRHRGQATGELDAGLAILVRRFEGGEERPTDQGRRQTGRAPIERPTVDDVDALPARVECVSNSFGGSEKSDRRRCHSSFLVATSDEGRPSAQPYPADDGQATGSRTVKHE